MKVKLKRFNDEAVIPQKAYGKDFCFDLVAVSEEQIAPNVWKYGFGFGLQLVRDVSECARGAIMLECLVKNEISSYACTYSLDMTRADLNLSIDIRPRSSVWKTGMVLSNCVGTVDEGYTNEISAVFYHVLPDMPRYKVGDRIAQMKIGFTLPCEFVEVEDFKDKTDRGLNGYGSTGL